MNLRKLGAILIIAGLAVIAGYGVYYFFRFAAPLMPWPFKVAIIAVPAGVILLIISILRERYRAAKKEGFREIER